MSKLFAAACGLLALPMPSAGYAQAQKPAPVEERASGAASPLLLQQQRASVSYRDLTQAAYDAKLAEQDVLNTQDAYDAARQRAESIKADLDKAIKARNAAKANEAAARKRYDAALNAETR